VAGIKHYYWVDSFLSTFDKDFSSEKFSFFLVSLTPSVGILTIEYLEEYNNSQKADGKNSS